MAANSSIPSKYQTLVTSNADKRGFGGTSKRFNHDATVVSVYGGCGEMDLILKRQDKTWHGFMIKNESSMLSHPFAMY